MRTKLLSLALLAAVVLAACAAPTAAPTPVPPTAVPPTAVPATAVPATASPATAAPAAAASPVPGTPTSVTRTNPKEIILATTTSTRDSGLLDVLLPVFEQNSGYTVKMVAVGSGQALAMGQAGNADVLLVHSPAAELKYMAGGYGINRLLVMHNDFLIVGPSDDPAKIKGLKTAVEAFKAIAAAQATFVSRGDASGTNAAELAIWKSAAITPTQQSSWYLETGQGMGDTLNVTSEKGAYTLTDRATYLAQQSHLQLDIMVQGDISLLNIYHVIQVNPDKWPLVNQAGAKAFSDFMVSPATQDLISKFGVDKYGQQLFFADAGKDESTLGGGAPSSTPSAAPASLTITGQVTKGQTWTVDDLKKLTPATVNMDVPKQGKQDVTGVRLSDLFALVQPGATAATVTFTGSDGYSADVAFSDVTGCADCMVAFDSSGGLYSAMAGMPGKSWVKSLVKIEIK